MSVTRSARFVWIVLTLILGSSQNADAAVLFDDADILVVTETDSVFPFGYSLFGFTVTGQTVGSTAIPHPSGSHPVTEMPRDLVMDSNGNVLIFNGSFSPFLSTFNPSTSAWNHQGEPGWDTVNNLTYGGIAATANQVFVTDMHTAADEGLAQGILLFNPADSSTLRFATDIDPIDLSLGLDGLLYALSPGTSPGGTLIHVYDPQSLSLVRSFDLHDPLGHTDHRAIAANQLGEMLVADLDGDLQRLSQDGSLLDSFNAPEFIFGDIDISPDGTILLGDRFGKFAIIDQGFSSLTSFNVPNASGMVFVSFASAGDDQNHSGVDPIPEPSSIFLFGPGLLGLVGWCRRKQNGSSD
jgi:hypothetical protein